MHVPMPISHHSIYALCSPVACITRVTETAEDNVHNILRSFSQNGYMKIIVCFLFLCDSK